MLSFRLLTSTEKEELKRSEVAQQTLCEFIHSLMAQCLANVRRKLEKEVTAVGHPILTPLTPYSLTPPTVGTSRQWPTGEGCGQTERQTAGHEQTAPCSWIGAVSFVNGVSVARMDKVLYLERRTVLYRAFHT